MTHEELRGKIAGFVHGVDSHGSLLLPWRHELDCATCERLINFIMGLLHEANSR